MKRKEILAAVYFMEPSNRWHLEWGLVHSSSFWTVGSNLSLNALYLISTHSDSYCFLPSITAADTSLHCILWNKIYNQVAF